MKFLVSILFFCFVYFCAKAQRPETPVIDSVSVDLVTGKVNIGWKQVANVDGYIVYRQLNGVSGIPDGSYLNIASINSNQTTNYTDISTTYGLATPSTKPEIYKTTTFVLVNGNPEYSLMSDEHQTIYLKPIEYNKCSKEIKLTWNKYRGWGANLKNQRVYKLDNSSKQILVARVSATDSSIALTDNQPNSTMHFFIRAINTDSSITSSSNIQSVFTNQPKTPDYFTAINTEVSGDYHIKLNFSIDTIADISYIYLIRKNLETNKIDTIKKYETISDTIHYTDSLEVNKQQYDWYIEAYSDCKQTISSSNPCTNLICNAKLLANETGKFQLTWNSYHTFPKDVSKYKLYRILESSPAELITETGDTSFVDDISSIVNNQNSQIPNSFCYYIEAIENGTNNTSKSNIVCTALAPTVYFPNVFNPNSIVEENRSFTPKISFVASYKLIIFNRWGQKIFESDTPSKGWEGKLQNNENAKEGTYLFYIKYTGFDDITHEHTGNITLIYN